MAAAPTTSAVAAQILVRFAMISSFGFDPVDVSPA
jgi:hypothetical protein